MCCTLGRSAAPLTEVEPARGAPAAPEGIKRAVRAGGASIEHGSFLDEEGVGLMKQRGAYLVADIYNDDYILSEYARLSTPRASSRRSGKSVASSVRPFSARLPPASRSLRE